jgi:hypothetical protein
MTDALMQALDAAPGPVPLFIRDDDAGWSDDALFALLDVTAAAGVPIDLAAIPDALTDPLAAALLQRRRTQPLGLHQHGCAHLNHETEGRKCEFGPARSAAQQRDDLLRGRARLQQALGDALDPIFTPPWNRCAAHTPALLAELGYAALSRDATATPQQALPECPVHVDWTRELRAAVADGADVGQRLAVQMARHVNGTRPVGLMLHHAVMDAAERALLQRLLARWAGHPGARWQPMRTLLQGVAA